MSRINFLKALMPLFITFVVTSVFFLIGDPILLHFKVSKTIMLGSNVLFFLVTLWGFFMQRNAMADKNPNLFVRAIIGSMFMKIVVICSAILIYALIVGPGYTTSTVVAAMFLYLIYLAIEVGVVTLENKKKYARK